MADDEDLVCYNSGSEADFDTIIGLIEEIVIDPKFAEIQEKFMEDHYKYFEECEENKLEYMDIFKAYIDLIEKFIETFILKQYPKFSMKDFLQSLEAKQSELDGEIFEILASFTDFLSFKDMLLDYKAAKEGITPDLSIVTNNSCNNYK